MTRQEMEQKVRQLLLEQRELFRFNLELPPDKQLLLERLLYRLGLNRMSRKQLPIRLAKVDSHVEAHPLIAGFPLEHALRHLANDPKNSSTLRDTAKTVLTKGDTTGLWALNDLLQEHQNPDGTYGHPLAGAYNWMSAADKVQLDAHTHRAADEEAKDYKKYIPTRLMDDADWEQTPEYQLQRAHAHLEGLTNSRNAAYFENTYNKIRKRVKELSPSTSDEDFDESIRRHRERGMRVWRKMNGVTEENTKKHLEKLPEHNNEVFPHVHKADKATRYRKKSITQYSRFKIGEGESLMGGADMIHPIHNEAGERIGHIWLSPMENGERLHINHVGAMGHEPNALGPSIVRGAIRQLKAYYPKAKRITGTRISGATQANTGQNRPAEVKMKRKFPSRRYTINEMSEVNETEGNRFKPVYAKNTLRRVSWFSTATPSAGKYVASYVPVEVMNPLGGSKWKWRYDGMYPHKEELHGEYESLPEDKKLQDQYLTPQHKWAYNLPGGEPPIAQSDELTEGMTGDFSEGYMMSRRKYASRKKKPVETQPTNYVDQEKKAFTDRIAEAPHDTTNRLVYADWAQEKGDNEEAAYQRAMANWYQENPDPFYEYPNSVLSHSLNREKLPEFAKGENEPTGLQITPYTGTHNDIIEELREYPHLGIISPNNKNLMFNGTPHFERTMRHAFSEHWKKNPQQLSRKKLPKRRYALTNRSNFIDALRRIKSSNQQAMHQTAQHVAKSIGMEPTRILDALHDTPHGSVPGVAQAIYGQASPEQLHAAAAWLGLTSNLPGVAVFHARNSGPDTLYRIRQDGSGLDIRAKLDRQGIHSRVLIPHRKGFDILIPDKSNQLGNQIQQYAKTHGLTIEASPGHFSTIGSSDQARAREMFRNKVAKQEQGV